MSEKQSNVIHQISPDVSTEVSFYRLLKNKQVDIGSIISHMSSPLRSLSKNRHVLVLSDSSEISLHHRVSKLRDGDRVGVLSDNKTRGYHLHVSMCLDAESGHGLGISDQILWNRLVSEKTKNQKSQGLLARSWAQKESYKWRLGIEHSLEVLAEARQKTFVFDAEADIGVLWQSVQELGVDAIIRLHYDRKVESLRELPDADHAAKTSQRLYSLLAECEFAGSYSLKLRSLTRHNYSKNRAQNRQGRTAQMEVRFTKAGLVDFPAPHPYSLIEAIENPKTVPQGEEPIRWVLMTTHPVESLEQAQQIIEWYALRWMIEQLFRISKKKGFDIEMSELEYLDSIFKQTLTTMEAAFRVMQLLLARGKQEGQPIAEVFSESQIQCLELLNDQLEGKTEKQKNPFPKHQLSWATWVIARLGGWKGYNQYRPPGPIILRRGVEQFYSVYRGWKLSSA